jgi:hypothetical protein
MNHLAPCPGCNRHVAVFETTCPFCAAALGESFRGRPRPAPLPRRLSRAAMMAAGATLIGACSANDAISSTRDAANDRPVATDGLVVPIYGAPFSGTGGISGAGGTGITGAAGFTDAGRDGASDAAAARDAAHDAAKDRSVIAIYGAAFAPGSAGEKPQG